MQNDLAYANADFIPGGAEYPDRWAEAARQFREVEAAVGRARLNQPYGEGDRQRFDLFLPAGRPEGLVVFVHGGFWHLFGRSYWSHLAAGPQARGWAVAVPSYTLAPEARVSQITQEIAGAVGAAAALVAGPIRLAGHSAGGHLVARMACRDVPLDDAVSDRLARIVPISPLADLRPLIKTSMNAKLRLDQQEAEAESPAFHTDRRDVPVTVWVGAEERPAFLDQARWLAEAWGVRQRIAPGRHHFDVIEELAEGNSPLTKALLG